MFLMDHIRVMTSSFNRTIPPTALIGGTSLIHKVEYVSYITMKYIKCDEIDNGGHIVGK